MANPTMTFVPLMLLSDCLRFVKKGAVEGVGIMPHHTRAGTYLASSGTSRTYSDGQPVIYVVTVDGCSCPAGIAGKDCKHYALGLFQMMEEGVNDIAIEQWELQMWVGRRSEPARSSPTRGGEKSSTRSI